MKIGEYKDEGTILISLVTNTRSQTNVFTEHPKHMHTDHTFTL